MAKSVHNNYDITVQVSYKILFDRSVVNLAGHDTASNCRIVLYFILLSATFYPTTIFSLPLE
jgi:hypothetical protein